METDLVRGRDRWMDRDTDRWIDRLILRDRLMHSLDGP